MAKKSKHKTEAILQQIKNDFKSGPHQKTKNLKKKKKKDNVCLERHRGKKEKKKNRLKVTRGPSRTILPPPRSAMHRCGESQDSTSEGSILSESSFPSREEYYNENS